MSFNDKKETEIKKYILRKIALDDADVIAKTADSFDIPTDMVKRYLSVAVECNMIVHAEDRACGYDLVQNVVEKKVDLDGNKPEEDRLYASFVEKNLDYCNENALRIWQYTCAEILNNAIEHSKGKSIRIIVRTNVLYSSVVIVDDGVGVFRTLLQHMAKNGWDNPSEEDAMVELYKGRITSDMKNHSGEGIFFSSRSVDEFAIWSDAKIYKCGYNKKIEIIINHLLAYASRLQNIGTMVMMILENDTQRKLREVFDMYTTLEEGFVRTSIPIKDACLTGEPVARSQARRICNRLDDFKEVIMDFNSVEFMGQGFADEIFRVYASDHPQVTLCPINMIPDVERMIRHVNRGQMSPNIRLEK